MKQQEEHWDILKEEPKPHPDQLELELDTHE